MGKEKERHSPVTASATVSAVLVFDIDDPVIVDEPIIVDDAVFPEDVAALLSPGHVATDGKVTLTLRSSWISMLFEVPS